MNDLPCTVIPAKAGISPARAKAKGAIAAFAGMTFGGVVAL
ncbi:hypothetical protein [Sphingopyxis sp. LK2115]|jgi:hypothetical protein|nr:hypothetical protein [Sphingopyxis sp. LK2115]